MESNLRKERNRQAALARRNIYRETPEVKSFFSSLTPAERQKIVSEARSTNQIILRKRSVKRRLFTTIGVVVISHENAIASGESLTV